MPLKGLRERTWAGCCVTIVADEAAVVVEDEERKSKEYDDEASRETENMDRILEQAAADGDETKRKQTMRKKRNCENTNTPQRKRRSELEWRKMVVERCRMWGG